nr:MAG TPA: Ubiquinone biosynthesis protein COQ7 [Caudoviricetes sp.]
MRTIKELMRQQIDELEDVIMYSCDALEHRPLRPGLADIYHKIAQQEENHAELLGNQLAELFNELQKRSLELPPELMKKWEEHQSKVVRLKARGRLYMDLYK